MVMNITFMCKVAHNTTPKSEATRRSRSWIERRRPLEDLQLMFQQQKQQVPSSQEKPVQDNPVEEEPVEEQRINVSPEAKEKLTSVGGHRSEIRVEARGTGPLICRPGLTRHKDYSQQRPGGVGLSDVMFR